MGFGRLNEIRCTNCNHKLCEGKLILGMIEIICKKCGGKNTFIGEGKEEVKPDNRRFIPGVGPNVHRKGA